jgi:hypothetical protein
LLSSFVANKVARRQTPAFSAMYLKAVTFFALSFLSFVATAPVEKDSLKTADTLATLNDIRSGKATIVKRDAEDFISPFKELSGIKRRTDKDFVDPFEELSGI